jgi:hypothetical protein
MSWVGEAGGHRRPTSGPGRPQRPYSADPVGVDGPSLSMLRSCPADRRGPSNRFQEHRVLLIEFDASSDGPPMYRSGCGHPGGCGQRVVGATEEGWAESLAAHTVAANERWGSAVRKIERAGERHSVAGYDMTFSSPKSVSVL